MTVNTAVYRIRKNRPGHGRKIAAALEAYEVTSRMPGQRLAPNSVVINYGRSTVPEWYRPDIHILNHPGAVQKAVDKRLTLDTLTKADVPTLNYTTIPQQALRWLQMGHIVYARTTPVGKKGKGIVIMSAPEDFVEAPLYTRKFPVTHEFRVHAVCDEQGPRAADYVQKKRLGSKKRAERGIAEVNEGIRNRGQGWVFCHHDIMQFPEVEEIGAAAIHALGLNWGGVDILAQVSPAGNLVDAVVCEVNSAPAVGSPTTFRAYINFFTQYIDKVRSGQLDAA